MPFGARLLRLNRKFRQYIRRLVHLKNDSRLNKNAEMIADSFITFLEVFCCKHTSSMHFWSFNDQVLSIRISYNNVFETVSYFSAKSFLISLKFKILSIWYSHCKFSSRIFDGAEGTGLRCSESIHANGSRRDVALWYILHLAQLSPISNFLNSSITFSMFSAIMCTFC